MFFVDRPGEKKWQEKAKEPFYRKEYFLLRFLNTTTTEGKGEMMVSVTKVVLLTTDSSTETLMSAHIDNERQDGGCKLHFKDHYCFSDMNTVAL